MLRFIPGVPEADEALVAAVAAGRRDALDALLRRHHDRLYALCRRIVGDDTDAADATQEAMIAIVRGLPRFDGRSSFATWSHRVAVNSALDELRRRNRRPVPFDGGSGEPSSHGGHPGGGRPDNAGGGVYRGAGVGGARSAGGVAGDGDADGDLGTGVADRLDIDAALRCLPIEFRVAVVLRDLSGLSYAEIAEVLDVPVGTVRSRISRGREALAPLLDPARLGGGVS